MKNLATRNADITNLNEKSIAPEQAKNNSSPIAITLS